MTGRRRRRASSGPRQVGSGDGLVSERSSVREESPDGRDGPATEGRPRRVRRSRLEQTRDDTDAGWGEASDDEASARWLEENRPPHW
ncbi:hypothetical protein [Knoellia remsis]|uniref:hypothetical protein n=1 Tax=Knoellia remsis TaxID=407159 RepID=UPI000D051F5F|nr:hypothetical protein [Knoellia remsis]